MGKVKSAIITAFLVAAIIVLALFATISCDVPGSNGVKRYNSFISSITMGSEFTGEAYAVLYPEGVISVEDYELVISDTDESSKEKRDEYLDKYVKKGGLYVDKDKLEDGGAEFLASIKADAETLSARFAGKGYSSYSVTIEDGYALKVCVPTNFTDAAANKHNSSDRSDALTAINHVITYLIYDGELGLRNGSEYDESSSLVPVLDDFNTYFEGAALYGVGGNYAIRLTLTENGFTKLNNILTSGDGTAYMFVGENNIQLTFTMGSSLENRVLYFEAEQNYAQDYALLLDSVIKGETLVNNYTDTTPTIIAATTVFGESAAMWLGILALLVLVGAIVFSVVKYKTLGIVNSLMLIIFAEVIVTASMLIGIQLTFASLFAAILAFALLLFTNCYCFEAIRKETAAGRTIHASVKLGYKKTLFGVLDIHVVAILAGVVLTLVGVGTIAASGFIFFIGAVASYVLYWFTRFMWYVISSPVKDKFAFAGYAREDVDDE